MDPGSGDLGETGYSGLPDNTVGMATMVDTSEASKQKSVETSGGRTCATQCPNATYALSVRGYRLKIQIMTQDDPTNDLG